MHKFNIESAQYQSDYKIFLTFDDDVKGTVNLEKFLLDQDCGVFARLRNKSEFKNFKVDYHTIVWGDDLDLAPEFLHDLLVVKNEPASKKSHPTRRLQTTTKLHQQRGENIRCRSIP